MKHRLLALAFGLAVAASAVEPPPAPTACPFGHGALSWQKVDYLCVSGPEKVMQCGTCGFAFDPWLKRWECRTGSLGLANGRLPDFSSVIRNLPLPQEKKEQEGVQYSQTRSAIAKLSDGCLYWTSADFDSTKARIREYLRSAGFTPEEMFRPYVGRVYSYFFARAGDRFLRVEVMLESNRQVAVDARILALSEIEHDYPLREALKIREPNPEQRY